MSKLFATIIICFFINAVLTATAQETKLWTESDRNYLVDNLVRTRELIIKETADLTKQQWDYKESPDKWSISEVIEHIAIWELLLDHEVSKALSAGLQVGLNINAKPDSIYVGFILEEKPHISIEYTKPFTYTLPMGLNDGKNNVAWFLKMRNESIDYLKTAKEDLRSYYLKASRPNIHQLYITIFGHSERHLRQIMKIKSNAGYPKS
jgi:DinB superfamily